MNEKKLSLTEATKLAKGDLRPPDKPIRFVGEPASPLMGGNWTYEEWKEAEAKVWAQRLLYNPDSLSAIFRDIAINLQAELIREKKRK